MREYLQPCTHLFESSQKVSDTAEMSKKSGSCTAPLSQSIFPELPECSRGNRRRTEERVYGWTRGGSMFFLFDNVDDTLTL